VFVPKQRMLAIMDQTWFRKLFPHRQKHQSASTQTKADNGDAEAQFKVGLRFASGERTADYVQAAHWYLKAADQNHASAQFNLAVMFAEGQGVPRDDARSMTLICKLAQQGHPGAQHRLGLRYRRASFQGLPADRLECNLEAYKWFRLAAAQGYQGSDAESGSMVFGMTRQQVAEGNLRAAAFTDSSSNPVLA
jgi:TPR repeat protein